MTHISVKRLLISVDVYQLRTAKLGSISKTILDAPKKDTQMFMTHDKFHRLQCLEMLEKMSVQDI